MIALIPLDNRPCNLRFPQQIAAIGNSELVTPPEELLGWFNDPGEPSQLGDWLTTLPELEALVVSIDMLAYGGLVASRRPAHSMEAALASLEALRRFRLEWPGTPVYAFNILMRLAVTLDTDAGVSNYYNVMRYARLVDEAERFQSEYLREQLAAVTAAIPAKVLREYLEARRRNHGVNLRMVEWLAEGVFDFLLITQEDASEYGLHRREQSHILDLAADRDVLERISLHPGADEAALTLLARYWDTGVRLRLHWSDAADAKRIAPFEDRPFDQALEQHVQAIHGTLVKEDEPADIDLFVNAPAGTSAKDEGEEGRASRSERLESFVSEVEAAIKGGRHVAVCDVAFPNGADDVLMGLLEKRNVLGRLVAFAGWNTAGNTTGTVLAQCAALKRSGDWRGAGNRQFLFERLIDDWFYQTRIRTKLERSAREHGLSPLKMEGDYSPVEAQARRELRGLASFLAQRQFGSKMGACEVSLPWHRTFEVGVTAALAD